MNAVQSQYPISFEGLCPTRRNQLGNHCYYTVEPLLVDSLYSGHNTKDLPIKDTFQGTKYTLCHGANAF